MSNNSSGKVRKVIKEEAKKIVTDTTQEIRKAVELINSSPSKKLVKQAV